MSRRIPSVNSIGLPDNRLFTATLPIGAGNSPSLVGSFYDIVSDHNLMLAMNHAQPVHHQQWEGQFAFNVAGYVDRYEITVPKLSSKHNFLRCRVYGSNGGNVRFTAAFTGNSTIVALAAGVGWVENTLDMTGAFAVTPYDTITIATDGNVDIQVIAIEWREVRPMNTYPGGDDELDPGVKFDNTYPLDTNEVDVDKPLASEIAQTLSQGVMDVNSRVRVYTSFGDISGSGMLKRAYRVVVPVFNLGSDRHILQYRMKVLKDAATARTMLIQHEGRTTNIVGTKLAADGETMFGYVQEIIAAGAGSVWITGQMTLVASNMLQAPGGYLGFANLSIIADDGLLSFAAWGV